MAVQLVSNPQAGRSGSPAFCMRMGRSERLDSEQRLRGAHGPWVITFACATLGARVQVQEIPPLCNSNEELRVEEL